MDLENRLSIKLKEYFDEKLKLLYFYELFYKIFIIIVTKEDKVYEFERNLITLLEFNRNNNIFIESRLLKELCSKKIIDFKNGLCHVIARTIDGKVYCWGSNEWGVLGNGKRNDEIYSPELNQYLSDKQIIDICCGGYHTLVLTNRGEVYAWGENTKGQIGNQTSGFDQYQLIPIKVNAFNDEKVIQISCGIYHSMALTESGHVFCWGYGSQIETKNIINKPTIVLLSNEIPIKKIVCGHSHSLMLSQNGDIYWFGDNICEQHLNPNKVINENKFEDIASHFSKHISIALSMNGIYYIWGYSGNYGEVKELKETEFSSFTDIFSHHFGLSFKSIDNFIDFKIQIIKNGKYMKEYITKKELGEGYYGQVFRVEKRNQKDHAIKKLYFSIDKEESLLKELENFSTFYGSNETNILELYDIWIENKDSTNSGKLTLYIEMELCDITLEEIIQEMKNDSNLFNNGILTHLGYYTTCYIFVEILKGVNYLHTREPKILHMDLHPGNILLKRDFIKRKLELKIEVKLADFGFAKICLFAQKSQTITSKKISNHSQCKSLNVLSNGIYSTRDDIYSLGIIMRELFSIDINR
jgi:alpha-tubulin suppressor-like RCC1 family protein